MKIKDDEIVEIEILNTNEEFLDIQTGTENYIAENIVVHNSRPSRRSVASGVYMPHLKKENIEVVCAIDTSGSMTQVELTELMSEIIYLAKSFSSIKMKIIICDCEIKEVVEIDNGNISKLENLKMSGGGGTSVKPIVDLLDNEYPTTKILVAFTDGYVDNCDMHNKSYNTLWVISKGGSEEIPLQNGGDIIKL